MNSESRAVYRETRQRKRILEILRGTRSHPTAEWIYERVKKEFPHISLSTVYRNLRILKEQGEIAELPFGDTFDRFDATVMPHPHFICTRCERIFDGAQECIPHFPDTGQAWGFKVEKIQTTFLGVCPECQ